jgi:hypothetical protein
MHEGNRPLVCTVLAGLIAAAASSSSAQPLAGTPAAPEYKYSTPPLPGVASPNKVETRFGTLNFFDGFPDKATAEKVYDNLDFQRAVQAYLLAIPAVSQATNRDQIRALGPVNTVVPIFEQLLDSRSVFLTANDNTVYSWTWIDLRNGPLVFEVPPKVLGAVNDMWYRWVVDVVGEGGKYLFLPPGYQGALPDGYIVVRSPTFGNWVPWRSFLVNGEGGPRQAIYKNLSAVERPQPAAPLGFCGPVRQAVQHRRAGGLPFLGIA